MRHKRHTFASRLAASGVSLPQIKDWLGHSTIDMVLRYAHLCPHANDHLIHALEVRSGHQVGTGTTPATANA